MKENNAFICIKTKQFALNIIQFCNLIHRFFYLNNGNIFIIHDG